MLVDYKFAVYDTANSIFLNFYKATPSTVILTEEDTSDLIAIMADDYGKDLHRVESDVSLTMRKLVYSIPHNLLNSPPTYH